MQHPGGLQYTAFCERYRAFLKRRQLSMRQHHVAGDKMFVDYSGKRPQLVDRATGEVREVELFVAVLGASNYSFAEATHTQRVRDFVGSHVRAFAFFEGVARAVVPDNLKSGVTRACIYEPTIQRSYQHMAEHYGTVILPARARKPRDKAKVEGAVRIVQRWVLGRLRNRVFHSLTELNAAIRECVDDLNRRRMRTYGKSRLEMFEQHERATLLPLPQDLFEITEWRMAKVNIDYHVEFDGRLYSVPYPIRVVPHPPGVLSGTGASQPMRATAASACRRPRPHAERAPRTRGVDPIKDLVVGIQARSRDQRALRRDPGRPTTPRAGLSLLPRDLAAREEVRRRPRRGRVRALHARRRRRIRLVGPTASTRSLSTTSQATPRPPSTTRTCAAGTTT